MTKQKIKVKGREIIIFKQRENDYISLTDIAKYKNSKNTRLIITHWLRTKYTTRILMLPNSVTLKTTVDQKT